MGEQKSDHDDVTREAQARMDAHNAAMDEDPDRHYLHQALLLGGPPDYELLTDPLSVLTDASRTPSSVSEAVMRESLVPWLRRVLIAVELEQGDSCLFAEWPFPVGRRTFATAQWVQTQFKPDAIWRLQRALPFTNDGYAALVLTVEHEGATVDVFGMVTAVRDDEDGFMFYECAPAQVSWNGLSPYTTPGSGLESFVRAAVKWWGRTGSVAFPKPEGVGRPKVTFMFKELSAHLAAYRDMCAVDDTRLTQVGLAAHIGCDAKTLRKELRRHGIKLR